MSFSEIGTSLYNAMLLVKNTDAVVGAVYNYDIKIESGTSLPAIIISPIDGDEVILDSCKNDVSFNFAVRVIDDIQTDYSNVEANMRVIADTVLERLKDIGDITYTNGNTYKLEYSYSWGYIEAQSPLRIFEIKCKFNGIKDK